MIAGCPASGGIVLPRRRPKSTIRVGNQLGRSWENLLLDSFEDAMRAPSSALPLMANHFVRTAKQLMFTWSFAGVALEALTSHDKLKLGDKSLHVYQMLVQHIARDNSILGLARRKDATCFLRRIMSVITHTTVQMCHQKAKGSETMERRVSIVVLNVYQSTGIKKEESSRQSLERHGELEEIRGFHNKKFEQGHDIRTEEYAETKTREKYKYLFGVMGIAYKPGNRRQVTPE